jgi:predicted DNA-binding transcriptional regulator AlpA
MNCPIPDSVDTLQLPLALSLPFAITTRPKDSRSVRRSAFDRIEGMDARLSTAEVVRIVGVNRSTLFRWMKKGTFPPKHLCGGWRKSDIEIWLASSHAPVVG